MEDQEEAMKHMIFKGKRTRRQRITVSPFANDTIRAAASSCSSGGGEGSCGGVVVDVRHLHHHHHSSCLDSGDELAQSSVEEEEDMANCLIILAQGMDGAQKSSSEQPTLHSMTNDVRKSAVDMYQCKTCNRCFPSFQALGGHRASHKKPKEDKKPSPLSLGNDKFINGGRGDGNNDTSTALSLQIPSGDLFNKARVHECSICGAQFNSGQALGGHMRRHRPLPTVTRTISNEEDPQESKKQRTLLYLDLNLPAPHEPEEDCGEEIKYPFTSKQEVMVFSASPLVDCHY